LLASILLTSALVSGQVSGQISANCSDDRYQIFNQIIGHWQEYKVKDGSRTLQGSLNTELAVQGCALKQSFQSADKAFSFDSLAYVDETGNWREVVALSSGEVVQYLWSVNEEELIIEEVGKAGPNQKRLVIFDISENQYSVLDERSSDRGQTWVQHELIQSVRKPDQVSELSQPH